jgi:hypothetical protein
MYFMASSPASAVGLNPGPVSGPARDSCDGEIKLFPATALHKGADAAPAAKPLGGVEAGASAEGRYLTPAVKGGVDALLAADTDTLEPHDMLSAATWADTYRKDHRETAQWHFVDIELTKPDEDTACFGHPPSAKPASSGPAQACLVDRLNAFEAELKDPATPQAERIVALKFVLHFVGDIHQPLQASDNENPGGNCIRLFLGGSRTSNLHSYWDTGLIAPMGTDPEAVAAKLRAQVTTGQEKAWSKGDAKAWARGVPGAFHARLVGPAATAAGRVDVGIGRAVVRRAAAGQQRRGRRSFRARRRLIERRSAPASRPSARPCRGDRLLQGSDGRRRPRPGRTPWPLSP